MQPERWQQVKQLFNSSLERAPDERAQFLEEVCASDDALLKDVLHLLASHEQAGSFIEAPAFEIAAELLTDEQTDLPPNERIGAYRVLREIGRGGMGTVFLAERADGEFRHSVALKIIRQTLADSETKRHFKRERQILASLSHPNIARLFDGGVSADGEPFLVMEYVAGEPLLEFAAKESLDTQERLRLFLKVCSAVAYAHRNLIIHRDIKPSNILVTREGEPKLLDFGLAKILDEALTNETQTLTAFRAFTPAYASPEQIRGKNISTASDVYSLGVVLYELLAGVRPFDFGHKSFEEIVRTIDETEPPRPSDAVTRRQRGAGKNSEPSAHDAAGATGSLTPSTANASLRAPLPASELKGDLDNIVLTALRKEPERRYKSVEALAEDIEKHLSGLPVAARPNTFQYRASKFIKRNRVGVTAASLVVLSLIAGLSAALWQASVAREKASIAAAHQARAEENEKRAELSAAKSKKITGFMEKVLSYANPAWYAEGNRLNGQARVIDVLNDLSLKIETEFPDDADIRAELHHKCAEIFLENRMFERAEVHAQRALELRRQVFGERHAEVAKDLYYLGAIISGRGKILESEKLLRQAVVMFREVAPDNANLPYLLEDLAGQIVSCNNDFDEAEKLYSESLELFRRKHGEIHHNTARLYFNLSLNAAQQGDFARADELFREGETRIAQLADADWRLVPALYRGRIEAAKGNLSEGEAIIEQAIVEVRKIKGENSSFERSAKDALWPIYELRKDWAQAARLARENVEAEKKTISETSIKFGQKLVILSLYLLRDGKTAEAKPVFEKAYRIFQNNRQDEATYFTFLLDMGECLLLLNRRDEALPLLKDFYERARVNFPANYHETIRVEKLLKQAQGKKK
ncbi:MAG: serine/threonine-protein kinase [Pyrinomonadaceae bacterium]